MMYEQEMGKIDRVDYRFYLIEGNFR